MSHHPVVDLDDDSALDRTIVGAKAARLAAARRVGLPVLAGVVVPVSSGREALAIGAAALETGGSGRARLAAMDVEVPADLLAALTGAVERLGEPVVVRSSSPMEGDTAWSGTFSSFREIGLDDLRTAVRGVWASAFTVHAVERYEAIGFEAADVELAILVQPQVDPDCGGSARRMDDGRVSVHGIVGAPHDLLQGWETGVRALVDADGAFVDGDALAALGEEPVLAAAALARDVHERLGDDLIEWAWSDGRIHLLQSTAAPLATPRLRAGDGDVSLLEGSAAVEAALLVERFPGPLGEQLVLPWAFALGSSLAPVGAVLPSSDPLTDLGRAVELAAQLTKQAWQDRADGGREVVAVLTELRGTDPLAALGVLGATRRVDAAPAREVIELVQRIATALVADRRLRGSRRIWRATVEQLRAIVLDADHEDVQRTGPDRWEPFLHAAIRANGQEAEGIPVVPGICAGRVVVIRDPHDPPQIEDRDVIVADRPLPALAPLLWRAGGLVTATGNPAAHLMEVANSVALPTVLAVDLVAFGGIAGLARSPWLAAVDGDAGTVAFLPAGTRDGSGTPS
jgi:phosphohistidine swiveling domain-containing protein